MQSELDESVAGEGFPAIVAAMNRAVGRLGEDIVGTIRSQAPGNAAIRP